MRDMFACCCVWDLAQQFRTFSSIVRHLFPWRPTDSPNPTTLTLFCSLYVVPLYTNIRKIIKLHNFFFLLLVHLAGFYSIPACVAWNISFSSKVLERILLVSAIFNWIKVVLLLHAVSFIATSHQKSNTNITPTVKSWSTWHCIYSPHVSAHTALVLLHSSFHTYFTNKPLLPLQSPHKFLHLLRMCETQTIL